MIVENYTTNQTDELRQFILRFSEATFYSEPRFLSLLKAHLDCDIHWLTARSKSKLIGVLPYAVKTSSRGKIFNSLPYYGSYGGVISADSECKKLLVKEFYNKASNAGALSATLISNPMSKDLQFYNEVVDTTHTDERIGQITDLPANSDQETLMDLFSDPRPRNIRRAKKENIRVEKGGSEMLGFLYQTHCDNMAAIGGVPKKECFFDQISDHMEENDWSVFTAFYDDKPVAALLVFYFNQTVEYFTPVTAHEFRNMQPMALIVYEAMLNAIELGMKNWNWGGTWLSQKGVYDFKKKWGATDRPYRYFVKVFSDDVYYMERDFLTTEFYGFYSIPFEHLRSKS